MPRPLDYASARPSLRPSPALFAVAAVWWGASLAWLIHLARSQGVPGPFEPFEWLPIAAAAGVLASISAVLWMSLFRRHAGATRTAILLLSFTALLILFLGLASFIAAIAGTERPAVISIILAETLIAGVLAGLSAWLFRCWLHKLELAAD